MYTWIFSFIFVLSKARSDLTSIYSDSYDYCYLTKHITTDLKYHEIVLLIDNDIRQTKAQMDYLKECILQYHPTMLIDFDSLHILRSRLQFEHIGSPRSTSFYMLLYHRNSNLSFEKVFNDYTANWMRSTRPKWLSIDLSVDYNLTLSTVKYKSPLHYAWQHKFLDFTVAEIKGYNRTAIHSYNPFNGQFTSELFDDDLKIFPDKMHDMHGYNLKTIFLHEPPGIYLEQDEFGKMIKINGTGYWNVRTLAEVLNFNLTLLPTFANDYVTDQKRNSFFLMSQLIRNGTIDFSGNQLYVKANGSLQQSCRLDSDNRCAVVPIRQKQIVRLPTSFGVIIGFSAIYILLMVLVARIMKFNRYFWTWFMMIRVLFGVAFPKLPCTLRERMLMGYIILLSLFYVSDLFSKMTDLKVKTMNVRFKSFKELDESGLIPLVYHQDYNEVFSSFDDKYIINLKEKAQLWNDPVCCANLLVRPNNTNFCILSERLAHYMISKFRKNNDGKRRLGIMKPCFITTWKGYAFTPASPYVEKFDEISVLIFESGLPSIWESMMRRPRTLIKKPDNHDKNLAKQLTLILIIGYFTSACVFLLELAFHRWQFQTNHLICRLFEAF